MPKIRVLFLFSEVGVRAKGSSAPPRDEQGFMEKHVLARSSLSLKHASQPRGNWLAATGATQPIASSRSSVTSSDKLNALISIVQSSLISPGHVNNIFDVI